MKTTMHSIEEASILCCSPGTVLDTGYTVVNQIDNFSFMNTILSWGRKKGQNYACNPNC